MANLEITASVILQEFPHFRSFQGEVVTLFGHKPSLKPLFSSQFFSPIWTYGVFPVFSNR